LSFGLGGGGGSDETGAGCERTKRGPRAGEGVVMGVGGSCMLFERPG
jgi:hypothetical protein